MEGQKTLEVRSPEKQNNGPLFKYKCGSVESTCWLNHRKNQDGKEYDEISVKIERRYKDRDGIWKSSNYYRTNDLPKMMLCGQKAYEFVVTNKEKEEGVEAYL